MTSSLNSKDFFAPGDVRSGIGEPNEMARVWQSLLTPATRYPERHLAEESEPRLNISVVFTSVESTLGALREAGRLASSLGAHVTLLVPQIVPYPLALDGPPVAEGFNERRLRLVAGQSRVDTTVQVCLCRDRVEALRAVLPPHSLVVVGGGQRWWPTSEQRLADKLRRAGHEVIVAERN